jgi:hypothetical protein
MSLRSWELLDHLILVDLLLESPRPPDLRRYSADLAARVEGWMETAEHKSVLFTTWIGGTTSTSRAEEVIGSLGIDHPTGAEKCRRRAYIATFRAMMLHEMGQGRPLPELSRQWDLKNLDGQQERWRDATLWVLSGLAQILTVPCFFYHLKEHCQADDNRVHRISRLFQRMKAQTHQLQEMLKYCSPLGPVARRIREMTKGNGRSIGAQTLRKLEETGITDLPQLAQLSVDDLKQRGIRQPYANIIRSYVRRRMQ